jgi:hypothetical protein
VIYGPVIYIPVRSFRLKHRKEARLRAAAQGFPVFVEASAIETRGTVYRLLKFADAVTPRVQSNRRGGWTAMRGRVVLGRGPEATEAVARRRVTAMIEDERDAMRRAAE